MRRALSKDGTATALEQSGLGSPVILVDGTLCLGDAVKLFMKTLGAPGLFIASMRFMPVWSKLTSVARTLPYDFTIPGDTGSGKALPATRWTSARRRSGAAAVR